MSLLIWIVSTRIFICRSFYSKNYTTDIKVVTLYLSLMQKMKERNHQTPMRFLVDHKRGQKFRNSWRATEEGSLTEMQRNLGKKSIL